MDRIARIAVELPPQRHHRVVSFELWNLLSEIELEPLIAEGLARGVVAVGRHDRSVEPKLLSGKDHRHPIHRAVHREPKRGLIRVLVIVFVLRAGVQQDQ